MLQVTSEPATSLNAPLSKPKGVSHTRQCKSLNETRITLQTAATKYTNCRHEAGQMETSSKRAAHVRVTVNRIVASRERTKQCVTKLLQLITDERQRDGLWHQLSNEVVPQQQKPCAKRGPLHERALAVTSVRSDTKSTRATAAKSTEMTMNTTGQMNVASKDELQQAAEKQLPRHSQYDLNGRRVSATQNRPTRRSLPFGGPAAKTPVALNKTVRARLSAASLRRTLSDPSAQTAQSARAASAIQPKSVPLTLIKPFATSATGVAHSVTSTKHVVVAEN